jgi:pimeloyl-ACP methyl ester carboxylesterase
MQSQKYKKVIGVGHSMGATLTLMAAFECPDRFSSIILIDPVILPPWIYHLWELIARLRLNNILHPLIPKTLRRRRIFPDKEEMFQNYRKKEIFKRLDNNALLAYVESMAKSLPDGQFELAYSPEWEAQIYATASQCGEQIWEKIPNLAIPLLIIRGQDSDTFWPQTARLIAKHLPDSIIQVISNAGHLVPLEKSIEVNLTIHDFLSNIENTR